LWAISEAQEFIYIEQQFFISSLGNEGVVHNAIAAAIVKKVIEKFEHRKAAAAKSKDVAPPFRVIILIPQLPEGDFTRDAGVRAIMYFQSRTIRTMLNDIANKTGVFVPGELVLFASLRAKGEISGITHTNQCYIHSKMLIVDDKIAIIGSANVNDRSMCGSRDSEICAVVQQMPNQSVESSASIKRFRMRLWNRYCGLPLDSTESQNAASFAAELARICLANTSIYEKASCFCMPCNSITNMLNYTRFATEASMKRDRYPDTAKAELSDVIGFLVMFPVHFLKEDTTLTPRYVPKFADIDKIANLRIFTA
jgi:phosphatidylserine/phosphatidylglycerophosphate/cardiolipin synthase-like enzyme